MPKRRGFYAWKKPGVLEPSKWWIGINTTFPKDEWDNELLACGDKFKIKIRVLAMSWPTVYFIPTGTPRIIRRTK